MSLDKKYCWYLEEDNFGLLEASSATDIPSLWQSISTASKTIRILAVCGVSDFNTSLEDTGKTYSLPVRFRRALAWWVIARGYEDPRNFNDKRALIFDKKVFLKIRDMKKVARSNRQSGGAIKLYEY